MSRYTIPPDIREKEKIVGGIFTVSQTIFLAMAALLFFSVVSSIFSLTGNIPLSLFLGILAGGIFVPFAVLRKREYGNIEIAQYLIYLIAYKRSKKEFPNINEYYRR